MELSGITFIMKDHVNVVKHEFSIKGAILLLKLMYGRGFYAPYANGLFIVDGQLIADMRYNSRLLYLNYVYPSIWKFIIELKRIYLSIKHRKKYILVEPSSWV